MNKSRKYILNMSYQERKTLALKVRPEAKAFYQYLYQIGKGYRTPSRRMAVLLQKVSNGRIKASDFEREALKSLM